jgi:hypothetical protein
MRWCYLLLLVIPIVIGENNVRSGGDFLPSFIAGSIFAMIAIGSMEGIIFSRRLLRRPRPSAPLLQEFAS